MSSPTIIDPAPAWQRELAKGYGRLDELLAVLGLDGGDCGVSETAARRFPMRVPRGFAARMRHGDPADPLLLQVLPVHAEQIDVPGYVTDPVGDLDSVSARGLLRKYEGRALVLTTGACAVHCRYCFRRNFPYGEQALTRGAEDGLIRAVAGDAGIREVILSGGDPLVLGEERLEHLLRRFAAIPHVERLRLHSRVPIVLPERVDARLLRLLSSIGRPVVVVVHANHPAEIDEGVAQALRELAGATHSLLNQCVLLHRVNDDADSLAALSERLFAAGALPYYLHQLDPVAGAAHYQVPDERALALMEELRARLPGYLVPRLVRERPGAPAKEPVTGRPHEPLHGSLEDIGPPAR